MGIDRPDDADEPSKRPADRSNGPGDGGESADRHGGVRSETRSRQEYYEDLWVGAAKTSRTEPRVTADPGAAAERAANGKPWDEVTGWSRRVWEEYQRKWPPGERGSADRPGNEQFDQECDQIAQREKDKISPALHEIESRDPDRRLVGFEHRLKDRDRTKEKITEAIEQYGRSPKEALSDLPDAIRYTFEYEEARYSQGARADIGRLKDYGFKMVTLKNFWRDEQYKGINSQWVDPDSGQRFEVQFHTRISFEAKQVTHPAYERLRSQPKPDELETMVLRAFQREVSAAIPIPPGAADVPDYPVRGRNAR